MKQEIRVLSSKSVYEGRVVRLKLDRVIEPGGIKAVREVVEHPGSVVVIPRLPGGRVIMVRQYRYPARRRMWELVAGTLEPSESVIHAARRELLEEIGYRAGSLKQLLSFYPSPGFLTERMYLVEARDLTLARAEPEPDERIQVREFSRTRVDELLLARKIIDGKSLVGLMWASCQQTARRAEHNR